MSEKKLLQRVREQIRAKHDSIRTEKANGGVTYYCQQCDRYVLSIATLKPKGGQEVHWMY